MATWTSQKGTVLPETLRLTKGMRGPAAARLHQASEWVPAIFHGCTIRDHDAQGGGACLPLRPGDKFCVLCRGLRLNDIHDKSKFHRSMVDAWDSATIELQRSSDPGAVPMPFSASGSNGPANSCLDNLRDATEGHLP